MLNFIDLFAGAGGLSEGFTAIGFNPVAHVEMNAEACNTLKTRACYYYLKNNNKLDIYRDYLLGKISRDVFYSKVPTFVTDSVINQTMSDDSMPALFERIDDLLLPFNDFSLHRLDEGFMLQELSLLGYQLAS